MTHTLPTPETDIRFPGSWSLDERGQKALEQFLHRLVEFGRSGSFLLPFGATFTFSEGRASVVAELPDEKTLTCAAVATRHFVQERGNPTLFGTICNLLMRGTKERRFHDHVEETRQQWHALLKAPLKWQDASVKTRGELLDHFFNGKIFHTEPEYQAFLERTTHGIGPMFTQQFAETLFLLHRVLLRLSLVVRSALGHDLLAPTPTAKQVRRLLEQCGVGIGPIAIQQWGQDPSRGERCGVQCDLQFKIETDKIESIMLPIHAVLVRQYPGLEDYGIFWFTPDGIHKTRYFDPDGRSESSVWRAFNRALNALRGMGPKLPEALAEIETECELASRAATKRGNRILAALLTEIAEESRAMKEEKAAVSAVALEAMRGRWTKARDR